MAGESNARQQLQLLLASTGYNLYNAANRARADDLLVRQSASDSLGQAVSGLTRLAGDYRQQFVPPSTRDHPFPPAERMAALNQIQQTRERISSLASHVRGLSAPTQDAIWARIRREQSTLEELLEWDYRLLASCRAVRELVEPLTAAEWNDARVTEIQALVREVEEAARKREELLSVGKW